MKKFLMIIAKIGVSITSLLISQFIISLMLYPILKGKGDYTILNCMELCLKIDGILAIIFTIIGICFTFACIPILLFGDNKEENTNETTTWV